MEGNIHIYVVCYLVDMYFITNILTPSFGLDRIDFLLITTVLSGLDSAAPSRFIKLAPCELSMCDDFHSGGRAIGYK